MHSIRAVETRGAMTSCRIHSRTLSFGNMRSAFAMRCLSILRVHSRIVRTMSVANEAPQLEPVVARDLAPALPSPVRCDNIVEALA